MNMYYPPDTSATAKVAQSMVEALSGKHEVTVVCGRPSYDPTEKRSWKLWRTEGREAGTGREVKIIRVGSTDYSRLRMKRRVLNYLSYALLAAPRSLAIPCDVMVGMTDPPFAGIVAAAVAGLKSKPFVYNIQDMYPDMAVAGKIVRPGLLSRAWEKMHRWALRRAARVVVLGDDMAARVAGKGVDRARVSIVRAGTAIRKPGNMAPGVTSRVVAAIRGNFRFVALHAGNMGFYGSWDTLVEGARLLEAEGVGLVFVGDGAERARVETLAAGLSNVRFLPFFDAGAIPSVLDAPDVHIVTIRRGLEGVVVPSKMYGIMAAGKPIVAVASKETDVARFCQELGIGICSDPDDPAGLAKVLRSLAGDPGGVKAMGAEAIAAARGFDRDGELRKLVEILGKFEAK